MGVESNRVPPPLPAPTETESTTPTELATDLATDVSIKHGDEISSYSLPEDGTPVTIKTRGHQRNKSQTSLLIEYFEHSKVGSSTDRKPSVRVRLTPSSKSRENDHHIQITKTKSSRKATASRRIPLHPTENGSEIYDFDDGKSMSSYASATEESNVSRQIEVDIDRNFTANRRTRRPASPLIPIIGVGSESRTGSFMQSEVSAIPTDSFLDGTSGQSNKSSGSPYLPAEKMPREKSSGRERPVITAPRPKEREKEKKHRSSKSRSTSMSKDHPETVRSRRSSRSHHQDSLVSGADSSVLSSQVSESMRSGTSKASSINNPKLLETVEDAIRRLILPELNALKREQSKRGGRPESLTTSSVTSMGSTEDFRHKRRSTKSNDSRDTIRYHESRNREARNDLEDSPRDFERESIDDSVLQDNEFDTPKRSNDKFKVAAAGAAVGAASSMTASVLSEQTSSEVSNRRRRRSAKKAGRGNEDTYDEFDGGLAPPMPPMPLSSEINPSEMTRASILSATTDSPHSATEEVTPMQQLQRGAPLVADNAPNVSQTPSTIDQLGAHHANVSRGDLKDLPRQRTGEFPKGIEGPVEQDEYEEDDDYEHNPNPYAGLYTQDVPAPLNYVPYQPASRGLSPIESVSGYTDGHSEIQPHQRDSRITTTTGSFSPTKSPGPQVDEAISNFSALSDIRSQGFDDPTSPGSSALGYRNTTYTEDSEIDRVQSGQAVRLVGANPNFVNSPVGVESNVASLVDGSAVDASVLSYGYLQQQSGSNHGSVASLEERRSAAEARGISPGSPSVASRRQVFEDRMESPLSRKSNLSREYQEYEPDQYGRKVPISTTTYRQSPTPSETAIAGAAVAALKQKAKQKDASTEEFAGEGVSRNKSFKERAQTHELAPEPKHSVDRFSFDASPKMVATGLPDFHDPMPAIGYGADDHSVVEGPLGDGAASPHSWEEHNRSANATPTQKSMHSISHHELAPRDVVTPVASGALVGAGAAAAAGLTPGSHARSQDVDDDFARTSADRKRDTLLTNPYENASPIAVLPGMNPLGPEQYGAPPPFPSGTPLQGKVDEGYISQGPNRTPDLRNKGKGVELADPASYGPVDDPFGSQNQISQNQMRHMSGLSQGMASPFYDAATGTGIDRIENKDIVALMQHLMVRDAERSARDTEILVSLVRTAADMRNSFNAVTKLLGDVENTIITEVQENTEKTVKTYINGPRPYPGSATRSLHGGSQSGAGDEAAARKRNFLKKALKGLTTKGSNDLGRIEDMLMHLLSEVDVLKAQTAGPRQPGQSFEHLPQPEVQYEQDRGYEPEGIAGTSTASHASQSGPLSLPQRGPSAKLGYERKLSEGNRISTVPEEDDYASQHLETPRHATPTQQHYSNPNMLMSPPREARGSSVPLDTPPHAATNTGSMSQEQTPNTPKDKKKHKSSGSSSWFPKISRWSETTASSVGNKFRISGSSKKNQSEDFLQQPQSRSGSALDQYDVDGFLRTEPLGEDKLHMQTGYSDPDVAGHHSPSLQRASPALQPPPPITYMTPEDPKYKAHRNSLNLMHPQPRQGNTERFKMNLETKAQDFDSPMSPKSADWAGSATSLGRFPENPNHYADGSTEISAAQEYWGPDSNLSAGPPRPPKEPIDDTPTSTRLSKVHKEGSPLPFHSVESGYGTATTAAYTSPRLENRHLSAAQGVPTRRPSGPRAMTPRGDDEKRKRDTFGTVASQESETF